MLRIKILSQVFFCFSSCVCLTSMFEIIRSLSPATVSLYVSSLFKPATPHSYVQSPLWLCVSVLSALGLTFVSLVCTELLSHHFCQSGLRHVVIYLWHFLGLFTLLTVWAHLRKRYFRFVYFVYLVWTCAEHMRVSVLYCFHFCFVFSTLCIPIKEQVCMIPASASLLTLTTWWMTGLPKWTQQESQYQCPSFINVC